MIFQKVFTKISYELVHSQDCWVATVEKDDKIWKLGRRNETKIHVYNIRLKRGFLVRSTEMSGTLVVLALLKVWSVPEDKRSWNCLSVASVTLSLPHGNVIV